MDPEAWLAGAAEHKGSWWPDYLRWLEPRSGEHKPKPKTLGSKGTSRSRPPPAGTSWRPEGRGGHSIRRRRRRAAAYVNPRRGASAAAAQRHRSEPQSLGTLRARAESVRRADDRRRRARHRKLDPLPLAATHARPGPDVRAAARGARVRTGRRPGRILRRDPRPAARASGPPPRPAAGPRRHRDRRPRAGRGARLAARAACPRHPASPPVARLLPPHRRNSVRRPGPARSRRAAARLDHAVLRDPLCARLYRPALRDQLLDRCALAMAALPTHPGARGR